MNTKPYRLKRNGSEPAIDQGTLNGFNLSWNPDNDRFYVTRNGDTVATFKDWRNAVYYARTH